MKLLHGIAIGTGALILAYLGFKNPSAVASIFKSGGEQYVAGVKALQGR